MNYLFHFLNVVSAYAPSAATIHHQLKI